ncbi:aspartate carbamoyltransferase catalytic subunit [Paracoccus onubensis]|uniref:aspartate carbamoyltransferase catalytic subunit n=1 Tax=Paracoccus onubensis TaxID=1675788 RepID=UPI00272F333E|nr:aspartate carbamoyltransferase catalytic subunit [Paracoccus onubensis]MDP0930154.1 aspartate carbamoyltransferase catalytic subunit [Paracoccus onubensis]
MNGKNSMPSAGPDDWADILLPGEILQWRGRPKPGISLRPFDYFQIPFGIIFSGIALIWIMAAMTAGGFIWMFGILHFSVGMALVLYPFLWLQMVRRRTYYTLTNRRTMIARNLPLMGRSLESWHLERLENIDLTDRNPGNVYFAKHHSWRGLSQKIGLERIANPREVFSMISTLRDELLRQSRPTGQRHD